ncbi:MAG TPA: hypothetical protein VFQ51_11555 [Vicinamibacteria bacterium]|nr:hypothetical protein [Vicinamibacteria bacterium]
MEKLAQFLFVVALPLAVVGGGLVAFFGVGAFFEALEEPAELKRRIESAFRRPLKPARPIGPDHYYHQYWEQPGAKPGA